LLVRLLAYVILRYEHVEGSGCFVSCPFAFPAEFMSYTQDGRPLAIQTPLGKDKLFLIGLSGYEGISQLFSFHLEVLAEKKNEVAFEKLLGQNVTVEIELADREQRHFNGICCRVGQGEQGVIFTEYSLEIVPQFWLLTRKAQSRIFQHVSVPDILRKVFEDLDVTFELNGTFQPRDYCVQYRETDYNFACRLMEEEGIFFFFKHSAGSHKMVLANTPGSHSDLPVKSNIIYEAVEGGLRDEDRIYSWTKTQELRSGKYTLWDHCFELPHKHLEASKTISDSVQVGSVPHKLNVANNQKLEIYDFPGEYAQRFDGVSGGGGDQPDELKKIFQDNQRTVGIRMQEEAMPSFLIQGASQCRQFTSGHKFTLERHYNAQGAYVLTSVQHAAREDNYRSSGQAFSYSNSFTCIPLALPFRPPRVTAKPTVPGTQSAVVVGPAGEEILTDKYGRVKVQFHWDREGKNNADSSCWVRVGQLWAGRRWGASFWPRIGQEVIVDFLEGDPDQPIIVGSVYNADQMPPYLGDGPDSKHKKDNKVSGIKSCSTPGGGGYNEMRFDDTKGKEQIFVHAQRNADTRVGNDSMESVSHDRHLTVGGEKDGSKAGDQREMIFRDKHLKVHRNQIEQIGGNMELLIGGIDGDGNQDIVIQGYKKELIEKSGHLHVKGSRMETIGGSQSLTVGGSQQEKIGKKHAADVGEEIHLKAGMKVIIEAGVQLTIKGPGGFVDINPAGVTIQGTMVLINSGGSAGTGSGSTPAGADDAKKAAPTEPVVADNSKTGQKSN
jgi:type VI secretion system secreted protein VgrG